MLDAFLPQTGSALDYQCVQQTTRTLCVLCRSVCVIADWSSELEGLLAVPSRLGHPLLVCSSGWHLRYIIILVVTTAYVDKILPSHQIVRTQNQRCSQIAMTGSNCTVPTIKVSWWSGNMKDEGRTSLVFGCQQQCSCCTALFGCSMLQSRPD